MQLDVILLLWCRFPLSSETDGCQQISWCGPAVFPPNRTPGEDIHHTGDGTSGLTSYPRRRSKVSEAACLRPQRSAPARTRTRAVRPRVQRSDHWTTHASPLLINTTLKPSILYIFIESCGNSSMDSRLTSPSHSRSQEILFLQNRMSPM